MNTMNYAGRIISYYANNGHISEASKIYKQTVYLIQKSVDILLHVIAGRLICADNNPHWVALGILLQY
jgi:transcriptional regulator of met regulon